MKQELKNQAIILLDLAASRLEKAGLEYSQIWQGFSLSAHHNSKGTAWRPDPTLNNVDQINRKARPTDKEKAAWLLVKRLSDVEFDCVFVWHCIKKQYQPGTRNRYRLGTLLGHLTYKHYSEAAREDGHRLNREAWKRRCDKAYTQLASHYYSVFPEELPKEEVEDEKVEANA